MPPPPPPPTCRLLAGPAAAVAQAALAAAVLAALLLKRAFRENPRRPLDVWAADVAKQVVGGAAAHAGGLAVAVLAAAASAGRSRSLSSSSSSSLAGSSTAAASECGWYAVAFTVDTAVGTWLAVGLHRAAVRSAAAAAARSASPPPPPPPLAPAAPAPPGPVSFAEAVSRCGDYGKPPSAALWLPQAAEWVGCVLASRAACGALVALGHGPLGAAAAGVDRLFASAGPTAELAAVMVTGPLCLNALQAVLQDAVLARRRRRVGFAAANPPVSPRASGSGVGGAAAPSASSPRAASTDMEALLTPLPPDRAGVAGAGR